MSSSPAFDSCSSACGAGAAASASSSWRAPHRSTDWPADLLPPVKPAQGVDARPQLDEERRFRSLLALVPPGERAQALAALQAIAGHWPGLSVGFRVTTEPLAEPLAPDDEA